MAELSEEEQDYSPVARIGQIMSRLEELEVRATRAESKQDRTVGS
jgi:hypothetical protein